MTSSASDVGRRIALLRRRLGLSQNAFARQAGISRNALSEYERGNNLPKTARIARIAEAGGTSVDWLLNGRLPRAELKADPQVEAAVRALRALWRDPTRRRVVVAVLTALGRREA
jgi:transcriptional regulator with XRE-family HTH domain